MARLKAADFEDRMTLVEHLDELRGRIIFSGVALIVVAVACFWQNKELLDIANAPLPNGEPPLTLSPTEPFLTTLTVVLYSAILITMPLLLYQVYAFVLPALSPQEKKTIVPMLLMVPVLFICGVLFAYFVVVPAAIKFLLNFNDDQFNIQIRAREYYSFFSLSLLSVGVLFQIPVGILSVTRLGIVSPETLAKNRRYAILVIAVLAMLLPGTDPITMVISMLPLVLLFEFSLVLARWLGRPGEPTAPSEAVAEEAEDVARDAEALPGDAKDTVKDTIANAKDAATDDEPDAATDDEPDAATDDGPDPQDDSPK